MTFIEANKTNFFGRWEPEINLILIISKNIFLFSGLKLYLVYVCILNGLIIKKLEYVTCVDT